MASSSSPPTLLSFYGTTGVLMTTRQHAIKSSPLSHSDVTERVTAWGRGEKGSANILLRGNVCRHRCDSRPKTKQVDRKKSACTPNPPVQLPTRYADRGSSPAAGEQLISTPRGLPPPPGLLGPPGDSGPLPKLVRLSLLPEGLMFP